MLPAVLRGTSSGVQKMVVCSVVPQIRRHVAMQADQVQNRRVTTDSTADGEANGDSYFTLMSLANQCMYKPPSDWKKGVIESRRLVVNGADLHYEQTGVGENFILLVPGALGSTRIDFGPQLRNFDKEKFTLVALDPRGYGRSIPPTRDWSLEFFERDAEDAVGLMKMMRVKTFSVLGYEDGGTTALKLAAKYSDMVDKLVIWGTSAYVTEYDLHATGNKWTSGMKLPFVDHYGEDYFHTHWNNRMDTLRQYWTERKGNICVDDVQNVKCQTLILHGDKDPVIHKDHPEFLHANIRHSQLEVVAGGRHKLHLSHVEEFNVRVQSFLQEE